MKHNDVNREDFEVKFRHIGEVVKDHQVGEKLKSEKESREGGPENSSENGILDKEVKYCS